MRRSQVQQRAGSGRAVTKRAFGLALTPVQILPEPKPASQNLLQTAHSTPQAATPASSVHRLPAQSNRSSRASFGSAIEVILERPWRSISKTPAPARSTAPRSAFKYTPMEGVPERFEQPHLHLAIRRQSHGNKLRTPGSIRQCHAQKLGSPVSTARPDVSLRLQSPSDDEAQLQEVSPVVGLMEPQYQPDEQRPTGAEQYGSLGFFGSLCSAPPVTDAAGTVFSIVCKLV